jgi:hypothetical protein
MSFLSSLKIIIFSINSKYFFSPKKTPQKMLNTEYALASEFGTNVPGKNYQGDNPDIFDQFSLKFSAAVIKHGMGCFQPLVSLSWICNL